MGACGCVVCVALYFPPENHHLVAVVIIIYHHLHGPSSINGRAKREGAAKGKRKRTETVSLRLVMVIVVFVSSLSLQLYHYIYIYPLLFLHNVGSVVAHLCYIANTGLRISKFVAIMKMSSSTLPSSLMRKLITAHERADRGRIGITKRRCCSLVEVLTIPRKLRTAPYTCMLAFIWVLFCSIENFVFWRWCRYWSCCAPFATGDAGRRRRQLGRCCDRLLVFVVELYKDIL